MARLHTLAPLVATLAFAHPSLAGPPPADARPLSQILKAIEDGGTVAYIDEVEWDDDGYWEIEYIRRDGSRVEVKVDPVTGSPRR